MLEFSSTDLTIHWPDGFRHSFYPLWLRERSHEESNKDPQSGHRVIEAALLPLDMAIEHAEIGNADVSIRFSDGHHCRYVLDDLRNAVETLLPVDLAGPRRLWGAGLTSMPSHQGNCVRDDDAALGALLADVARFGFAIVDDIGSDENALAAFCGRIGPIRPTNWGSIADIKSIANGYCLSMTGRALEPHVDNPYRLPGPGYIFLHCLKADAAGGDSFLIDGFKVAAKIREQDPAAYRILSETQVGFHYADEEAILDHYGALIELDPTGDVRRVRFHNRADQVPPYDNAVLAEYYRARSVMAAEVWSEDNTLRFRLQPGQVLIIDNYRLFHGRTEIDTRSGDRHFRQCYMDRDAVSSRQKLLVRETGQSQPATVNRAAAQ